MRSEEEIGRSVAAVRVGLGMSEWDLASAANKVGGEWLGLNEKSIKKLESGRGFGALQLRNVAQALHMHEDDLYWDNPHGPRIRPEEISDPQVREAFVAFDEAVADYFACLALGSLLA